MTAASPLADDPMAPCHDSSGRPTPVRIRVLHVVVSLDPGGMENGIVNVAQRLAPAAFDVWVCGLERRGAFATRMPLPEQVIALDKPPGKSPRTVLALSRAIARIRPHVVHAHNLGPLLYCVLAGGGGDRRLLHGEHGDLLPDDCRRSRLWLRRMLYARCDRVHTVSAALTRRLTDLGFPPGKLCTVVNGVDSERFAPGDRAAARQRLGLPADGICLGAVGRLTTCKCLDLLLRALADLGQRQNGPAACLLIVGDGSERGRLEQLAAATGLTDRVLFTGHVEEPSALYRAMDLLVHPSSHEGLSNVILEAMSSGVPALAGDACGNVEMITDGLDGWTRAVGTSGQLAAELAALLPRPRVLAAAGERARETVLDHFSINRMVRGYADLYRELALT